MPEPTVLLAIGIPAVVLAVSLYVPDRVRRHDALGRWATTNGYQLITFRQPVLTEASAFPFSASKAFAVDRVEVEAAGGRRAGLVRLGNAWRGLASGVAEVRWDEVGGIA